MSTAQNENSHSTSPKYIELAFKYLPAYAQFLLTHHLEEFARSSLRVSRELQIPLLKYFEAMPEEVLVELSIQGNKEMLEYFSQNRVQAFIDKSIQSWLENQLPLIHYDEVVVEDITLVSFVRRKIFRDFLPLYSPDIETYIKVMEEMDKFSVHLEESCFKTLFDLKQKKINEHHHFIDKINNTSPGITYVFDLLEQKEVYSNHKREELLGYTEADLKEMGSDVLSQILHEEDLSQAYTNQLKFSSADDGEMFTHEYRVRNKKGEFRWHRTYETIFKRSDAGVPTQIIGIAIDISQEKEAASQLEQSEHRLSEAQEIAGMGSFEWNLSGGTSVFSTQLLKIFALPQPGNLLSFLEDVHPSDRPKVRQAIEAAISGNGHYECEYRYGAGDTEKVIWSRGLVIFEDGKPIKMKGTVMDVTQRHHMLKRLERSEELHKQAQALTHIGNWTWSVSDNKITWSDEMYRIYGLEPQSETISFDRFLSFIHPEDRQKRSDEIQRALHTHIAEDYTMRIISADGTSKILQGKGEVLVDEAGQPYKLVGTCQDVTKQALLHQRLKENEAAFRQLIANAPDAVIVIDENSKVVLWNPKSESLFGWSAEEIIGKSLMETIIPQAYRAGHLLGVKRMHETG
ncbi:MAG: PAS domain-containing protein, partial [Saprospiraceae bacterium]